MNSPKEQRAHELAVETLQRMHDSTALLRQLAAEEADARTLDFREYMTILSKGLFGLAFASLYAAGFSRDAPPEALEALRDLIEDERLFVLQGVKDVDAALQEVL